MKELPPQHVGLGSKTSLLLAVLIAATECNGVKLDRSTVRNLSRRGGASGVGVHTFFDGGIVVDAGQKVLPSSPAAFGPSSSSAPVSPPLVVQNISPPADWRVTLILPAGRIIEGKEEQDFFRNATPTPDYDTLQTIGLVYHGLVPSLIEEDLEVFGFAIREMQKMGLKRAEVSAQSAEVSATMATLQDFFPAVGLSSMGPLIYAINSGEVSAEKLAAMVGDAAVLGTFDIADSGYEIYHD